MAIYEMNTDHIIKVPETRFGAEGVKERTDLQRVLRTNVGVVAPDTFILAEEFGHWEESRRRIDLLGLDKAANLVVIELKRTEDGGHMELQAIRYAAMVSKLRFEQAVEARAAYQEKHDIDGDAEEAILKFLRWSEAQEENFAQAVKIVLVSADFSKELTTTVMWLNTCDLDITCVRMRPHNLDGRILLDVQQIIPLPEAEDYQIQVRQKEQQEKKSRGRADRTRYDVTIDGTVYEAEYKNRAIVLVVKKLVDSGVTPDQIADMVPWRSNLWTVVDGEPDSLTFVERATLARQAERKQFRRGEWWCDEEDLMRVNGRTYAFTKCWAERWPIAMQNLVTNYPKFDISYKPTKVNSNLS